MTDPARTDAPLLSMRKLTISFGADRSRPATVDGIDLDLFAGELVALVGESGSGKSLIAHTIAGILDPAARLAAERLAFEDCDILKSGWDTLRGRKVGIVFQNSRAALNPTRAIGRQIGDVLEAHAKTHDMSLPAGLRQAILAALAAVRIPDAARRLDAYPGELSGGMCQRVMLAIALAGNPSLLVADEPTTGLDSTTQAAVLALLLQRATAQHMATLLITHDIELARAHARRIVVMHAGQIVEDAPAPALFAAPRHPYSALLVGATPARASSVEALVGIPGSTPDLGATTPACRFADRCGRVTPRCRSEFPPRRSDSAHHSFHCWNPL
jgi:peptide/nickel transport system ATP-binding protein